MPIQNLHVLSWSFHILCSFYTVRFNWRDIYNVAVLKKNEGQLLCTLQLRICNSCHLQVSFSNIILFITFPLLLCFQAKTPLSNTTPGHACPLVRDFNLLQFSTSLSDERRIKNTLRRETWCGFVVGQKKVHRLKWFQPRSFFLALTIYGHK